MLLEVYAPRLVFVFDMCIVQWDVNINLLHTRFFQVSFSSHNMCKWERCTSVALWFVVCMLHVTLRRLLLTTLYKGPCL